MNNKKNKYPLNIYSQKEEKLNVISHGFGVILSLVAIVFLITKIIKTDVYSNLIPVLIYGISLFTLYTASTLFHSAKEPNLRYRLNIFDHSAIFFLIAGTYTPFTLIAIKGSLGWVVFSVIWIAAVGGIILKLFYTGKFRILSTIMYVLMGWIALFAIKPLYHNLDFGGFIALISGGIAYTIGAVLYAIKKIKYNHAIFHLFVLLASVCHFISVYFYVI